MTVKIFLNLIIRNSLHDHKNIIVEGDFIHISIELNIRSERRIILSQLHDLVSIEKRTMKSITTEKAAQINNNHIFVVITTELVSSVSFYFFNLNHLTDEFNSSLSLKCGKEKLAANGER